MTPPIIKDTSGLCYIDLKSDDPLDLFQEWYKEAWKFSTGLPNALCLATTTKDYKVGARHVALKSYDSDGFVFFTDKRSRKVHDLEQVSSAAMCFLWAYINEKDQKVARQVRIEGNIKILDSDCYEDTYENAPFFNKIRAHICQQDQEVDWNELKMRHDQLLQDVIDGRATLPLPDHYIGYNMIPESIEFYYARDKSIGDRILFEKDPTCANSWTHKRIAA